MGGFEPPTSCVSDKDSKPTELHDHKIKNPDSFFRIGVVFVFLLINNYS